MKKVFEQLKPYTKESILGPAFKLLEALLELFIPLVVASIIDVGISSGDRGHVIRMCLVMAGLGAVGLLCSVTAQYFAAKAAVGCVSGLRHALFRKIQNFDYTTADRLGTSTMLTRITSDMNQVQTGVNLTLRLLLRSPFIVFGAMIMAFTIDVKGALVFAVVIPVLAAVVFGIMLVSIPLYRKVQTALDGVTGKTRENLNGVRVLRAFNKEQDEIADFSRSNDILFRIQRFVGRISAAMNPATYVIINTAAVILIYTGALRVGAGILMTGQVVALYNYMSQILVELIKLANLIINITKSVACANRIEAVLNLPSEEAGEIDRFPENAEYAVEFSHVSMIYESAGAEAITDISFKVRPGETVGIIGATGSGKTTIVNLIPAFYKATAGEVRVYGADVSCLRRDVLRKRVAVVPQKALLFRGTIRDNLKWGDPEADDERLMQAIETAQATDIIRSKEHGLDVMIEQGGRNLSGGQRQRLTIARALVSGADILILDDSSSALDFATDAALRKALDGLRPKPAVFMVSQRTSSIMHADQIIVLDEGRCAGIGKHEDLLRACDIYREIHELQFRKEAER